MPELKRYYNELMNILKLKELGAREFFTEKEKSFLLLLIQPTNGNVSLVEVI